MQKKVATSNNPWPSAFRVFRNANGGWAVQNEDNSRGGIFISYEAAIRFVNAENLRPKSNQLEANDREFRKP
jgi:hypothetical protein